MKTHEPEAARAASAIFESFGVLPQEVRDAIELVIGERRGRAASLVIECAYPAAEIVSRGSRESLRHWIRQLVLAAEMMDAPHAPLEGFLEELEASPAILEGHDPARALDLMDPADFALAKAVAGRPPASAPAPYPRTFGPGQAEDVLPEELP